MKDFLLSLFTGSDEMRPFINFPNASNGFVSATDLYSAILIPENELVFKYGSDETFPNIKKLIDEITGGENNSVKVNVYDLSLQLAKARIIVDKKYIKCDDCNGAGVVDFEYVSTKGYTFEEECECPVCRGNGHGKEDHEFPRITMAINNESGTLISIGNLHFKPYNLWRLCIVATILGYKEFEILYNPSKPSAVVCFGNVQILTTHIIKY